MNTKLWGCQRNKINHAEPRFLNPLSASPFAYEKAWLSARLLSSMDTHLPERAFSAQRIYFAGAKLPQGKVWGCPGTPSPLYLRRWSYTIFLMLNSGIYI